PLGACPCHAVSNGNSFGRQIAHNPEKRQTTSRVAPKIDDQPTTPVQFLNCVVDLVCDIHADSAGKFCYFEPANIVGQFGDKHVATVSGLSINRGTLVWLAVLEPGGDPFGYSLTTAFVKEAGICRAPE